MVWSILFCWFKLLYFLQSLYVDWLCDAEIRALWGPYHLLQASLCCCSRQFFMTGSFSCCRRIFEPIIWLPDGISWWLRSARIIREITNPDLNPSCICTNSASNVSKWHHPFLLFTLRLAVIYFSAVPFFLCVKYKPVGLFSPPRNVYCAFTVMTILKDVASQMWPTD